ncbi:unnamed protein product [Cyclocybe aegerita]|uniref:Nephrocystin 3-like N-terminal domain-containing protein n=1 Tax=Cyclocybe aegerita TaxID=1973307 RepID=A0A8S0WP83_CYCAE|nr:unnamed protein product [Cyclocybe aegerita]
MTQSTLNVNVKQTNVQQTTAPASSFLTERIRERSGPTAFWIAKEPAYTPTCDPNTRLAVIEDIVNWITAGSTKNASMLWLHVVAGAGKIALGSTIAERCQEENSSLPAFVFSGTRGNGAIDGLKLTFTIALQLALAIPGVRSSIESVAKHDPTVCDENMNMASQMTKEAQSKTLIPSQ